MFCMVRIMTKTALLSRSRNGNGRNGHSRNGNGNGRNGNGHSRNGNGRGPATADLSSQDVKNYITPQGYARLRAELLKLHDVERPDLVKTISWAASNGDRSENGDYIYGKKRLREIDARVRHLRKRLDGMVVVDQPPSDPRRVFFGAWVTLEREEDGAELRYRIVGPDEFDMEEGYISMDAPLARALLGKPLDAEIAVQVAGRETRYVITAVDYAV